MTNRAPARALVVVLTIACSASAATTVERLREIIATAVAHHRSDADTASRIAGLEPSERITEDTLADLQSKSPGPRTAAALADLADASAFLEVPAAELNRRPPPSIQEQRAIFNRAAVYALNYARLLPNLMCTETIRRFNNAGSRRYPDQTLLTNLRLWDIVRAQVTYSDFQEHSRLLAVNNESAQLSLSAPIEAASGLTTTGEFGNTFVSLFSPQTKAVGLWSHWESIHGAEVAVFRYSVSAATSAYDVAWTPSGNGTQHRHPAYTGFVSIQPETGEVLRVTLFTEIIPKYPIRKVEVAVQYAPAIIGAKSYLLPERSLTREISLGATHDLTFLNLIRFSNYRKFESESRMITAANPPAAKTFEAPVAQSVTVAPQTAVDPAPDFAAAHSDAPITLGDVLFPVPVLPPFVEPLRQTAPSSGAFRTDVNLVPVPVIVRDRSGKAISALTKDDFELFDNGKPQTISAFEEQHRGAQNPGAAAEKRYLAFLFDDVHLSSGDLSRARSALQRVLPALLAQNAHVAILSTSGNEPAVFQSDLAALQQALARLRPSPMFDSHAVCPALGYFLADSIVNRHDSQALNVAAEQAIVQCNLDRSQPEMVTRVAETAARQVVQASESETRFVLAQINAVVRGVSHTFTIGLRYEREQSGFQDSALLSFAESTGGIAFHNSNDLDAGFRLLSEAPDTEYVLAFSPSSDGRDGMHRLKVTVRDRRDAEIQARDAYLKSNASNAQGGIE